MLSTQAAANVQLHWFPEPSIRRTSDQVLKTIIHELEKGANSSNSIDTRARLLLALQPTGPSTLRLSVFVALLHLSARSLTLGKLLWKAPKAPTNNTTTSSTSATNAGAGTSNTYVLAVQMYCHICTY